MKHHYIYKITNLKPFDTRKYYIGVRTCECPPEDDKKYMGSSKYLKDVFKANGIDNFKKEILSVWDTRKLANKEEIRLHELYDVAKNPNFYNKSRATTDKFCTEGHVTVLDARDGKTKNVSKEDYEKFDHYEFILNGKITVYDNKMNKIKKVTVTEFKTHDHFIHITQGQVTVLDIRDGKTKNVSKEDYEKFDYYEHVTKGQVTVLDTRDGKTKNVSKEDYHSHDYYEFITKDKIVVIDNTNNQKTIKQISRTEFEKYPDKFEALSKNKVNVLDLRDGNRKRVDRQEFIDSEFLISVNTGTCSVIDITTMTVKKVLKSELLENINYVNINTRKYKIFDENNKLIVELVGGLREYCKKNNLSVRLMTVSCNTGIPIVSRSKTNKHINGWRVESQKLLDFIE